MRGEREGRKENEGGEARREGGGGGGEVGEEKR